VSRRSVAVLAFVLVLGVATPARGQGGGIVVVAREGKLWAIDNRGVQPRGSALFAAGGGIDHHPAVAVDGTVAFDRRLPGSAAAIYVASPGTAPRRLLIGTAPSFSSLGGRVVFVRRSGLYTARLTGDHLRRVTRIAGDTDPNWGTNGLIAFTRTTGPRRGIYIVRPDGSSQRRVVRSDEALADPTWSPAGKELLVGLRADGARCRKINADVDSLRGRIVPSGYRVTVAVGNGCHVADGWAPSGNAIALSAGTHLMLRSLDDDGNAVICNADRPDGVAWASDRAGGWLVAESTRGRAAGWLRSGCPATAAPETDDCVDDCRPGLRRGTRTTVCIQYNGKRVCWAVH
jgi:hypothetical protein